MIKLLIALTCISVVFTIPYLHQVNLANSLIVGRDDFQDLYDWDCKTCDQSNKPIHAHPIEEKAKDVKCILSMYDDFIVLAFRYTNTAQNVWQDILYANQVKDEHTCSNCKVQKAYHDMWETIKEDVMDDLRQLKKWISIEQLYITGISMGGGLATIAFVDINHAGIFQTVDIITFGAPRVGNKNWAAEIDRQTGYDILRYDIKGDPIPDMPICLTLLCNYGHPGILIQCHLDDQICYQYGIQPSDEKKTFMDAMKAKKEYYDEINSLGSIIDHIDGYPKIHNFTLEIIP